MLPVFLASHEEQALFLGLSPLFVSSLLGEKPEAVRECLATGESSHNGTEGAGVSGGLRKKGHCDLASQRWRHDG